MSDLYCKNITEGLSLGNQGFLRWCIEKNEFLKSFNNVREVNSNYYCLRVELKDLLFVNQVGVHFSFDKIQKVELFNSSATNETGVELFKKHQQDLEKLFGKPKIFCSSIQQLFNTSNNVYKWDFKTVELIHSLQDRFGMEERVEFSIKDSFVNNY